MQVWLSMTVHLVKNITPSKTTKKVIKRPAIAKPNWRATIAMAERRGGTSTGKLSKDGSKDSPPFRRFARVESPGPEYSGKPFGKKVVAPLNR
jgi:hypothetical protein